MFPLCKRKCMIFFILFHDTKPSLRQSSSICNSSIPSLLYGGFPFFDIYKCSESLLLSIYQYVFSTTVSQKGSDSFRRRCPDNMFFNQVNLHDNNTYSTKQKLLMPETIERTHESKNTMVTKYLWHISHNYPLSHSHKCQKLFRSIPARLSHLFRQVIILHYRQHISQNATSNIKDANYVTGLKDQVVPPL